MTQTTKFTIEYANGDKFECIPAPGSAGSVQDWCVEGKVNGVAYNVFLEISSATRVFQVCNILHEAQP
jgi:hypothetical protein